MSSGLSSSQDCCKKATPEDIGYKEKWWLRILPRFLRAEIEYKIRRRELIKGLLKHEFIDKNLKASESYKSNITETVSLTLPEEKKDPFYLWQLAYNEIGRCDFKHHYVYFEDYKVYRGTTIVKPFK